MAIFFTESSVITRYATQKSTSCSPAHTIRLAFELLCLLNLNPPLTTITHCSTGTHTWLSKPPRNWKTTNASSRRVCVQRVQLPNQSGTGNQFKLQNIYLHNIRFSMRFAITWPTASRNDNPRYCVTPNNWHDCLSYLRLFWINLIQIQTKNRWPG